METTALRRLLPTMRQCALVAGAFIILGSSSSQAASATWISSSGSWSESAKWNGALPHGYNDIATFSNYGNGTVVLAGQAVKGIIFTTNASAYQLTGSTNYLEIEGGGFIQTEGTGANSQVISQAIAMRGAALSITNDYTDSSKTLTIAGPLYSRHNATSTLTLNGGNTGANTISGSISNNKAGTNILGLSKSGASNWILSGSNSYTGTTTISEGALMVTGTHSGTNGVTPVATIAGAYTVNGTGVLGGAGGKITASSITLSGSTAGINVSGAGLGTVGSQNGLTSAGTLELVLGTGSLNISQAGADSLTFVLATPGTSDHVKLSSGTLNIGNGVLSLDTFKFDISNWAVTGAEGTYTLFTAASSSGISGYLASSGLTGTLGGYGVELFLGTTESGLAALKLDVTAIPEPATIHILGLGLLAGCAVALRRKKA